MPGTGKLTLTGQLGDVMKESAKISLSLIRSRLAHTANSFDFIARAIFISMCHPVQHQRTGRQPV